MRLVHGLLLALVFATPVIAQAQQPAEAAPWQAEIEHRRQSLIERNGPGTDAPLRDQLLSMQASDQEARGLKVDPNAPKGPVRVAANLAEIDKFLSDQLKGIVEKRGWPTIALVGIDGSNAAMLLLTHTPDREWQRSLLPKLADLADAGKIDGSSLALVIDKDLIATGHLQRYGSQFKLVDGAMAMYAVEDPAGLDRRRAEVMLPPIDVYEHRLMAMYHLKVSKQIVMARAETAKRP
ncbi:hypothetical protein SAMN05421770_101191 [Granulicella rosea]|uniref:Uncharacterized protein n=1 Tax=Granulicella rosea TaxID=474952 RepID=A0A239CZY8_9BACT|nr:DUF6624 domain-containing protein [Granulicella rosea]SNS25191.1 hypothetical protein SAMN05421770_101191 [Granulicella rosea]